MQRLTLMKFKKMCESAPALEFSFALCNQPQELCSVEFTAIYQEMSIMFNPNRICFRGTSGTVCFNRVKAVNYYDASQSFGMVFGIVCGNDFLEEGETVYKVIADKKYGNHAVK